LLSVTVPCLSQNLTVDLELTHHQTTVERLGTDGDDDVFTNTLGNLGTRDQETVLFQSLSRGQRVALLDTLFVGSLLDQVGFTGSTRLVALDVVASEEDTVDGKNFTSLDDTDVTDENVLRYDGNVSTNAADKTTTESLPRTHLGVDSHPSSTSNTVDHPVVLLLVQFLELPLLLPIVDGSDQDDDGNSDKNGDTLDPFDLRFFATVRVGTSVFAGTSQFVVDTDGLVDTEDKRDNGGDTQDDLRVESWVE
jgi:hypothetical protein